MISIPQYRAKKINSDEYVEGYLYPDLISSDGGQRFALKDDYGNKHSVVLVTLAIHFPDMLDSEGNKIFASLREDGKGGDKLEVLDCEDADYVAKYIPNKFVVYNINVQHDQWEYDDFDNCDVKVTGIKQ